VQTFLVEQLDAIEDATTPGLLILRFHLGKKATLTFEIRPELVDALIGGIDALRGTGRHALSSKSSH
jgi:hypothetical protein